MLTVAELRTLFTGDVSDLERAQARAKAGNRAVARDVSTSWTKAGADASAGFDRSFRLDRTNKQIDSVSGRLGLLLQTATALGPGIVAGATPALAGLTAQAGALALGVGATAAAFYGIPDAVKAVNKADLSPTVKNLEAAEEAMAKLPPEGRAMVREIRSWAGPLTKLRDLGQRRAFPGMIDGLDSLRDRLPDVHRLLDVTTAKSGDLFRRAGADLAGDRWDRQFNHAIATTPGLLDDVSVSVGNVAHMVGGLWVAVGPLTDQWSKGLREASGEADRWASSLEGSAGMARFLDYAEDSGANLVETLGQITGGLLAVGTAAAPLTGPLLDSLGAVADAVGVIADSPVGTPFVGGLLALSAYNKALSVTQKLQTRVSGTTGVGMLGSSPGTMRTQIGMLGRLRGAYQTVVVAERELAAAQVRRTALARRSTDAQFALVPTSSKRAALRNYMGSVKDVKAAESSLALARQRTAGMWRESAAGIGKAAAAAGGLALAISPLPEKVGLANTASMAMMGMLAGPWGAAVGGGIGLLMDYSAANKNAAVAEQQTTAALKSGSAERVAARLAEVQAQRKADRESTLGKVRNALSFMGPDKGYSRDDKRAEQERALQDEQARTRAATLATRAALAATYGQPVARVATMSLEQFNAAVEYSKSILSGRAGLREYEASLDAASEAIKKNGQNLDISTEKGRENQAALDSIAATALDASTSLRDALQPLKAARILQRARQDLVDYGHKMGMSEEKAQTFAAKLFALNNTKANPEVDVEVANALGATRAVWDAINRLHDKNITITTRHVQIEQNMVLTKKGKRQAHKQETWYNRPTKSGEVADGGTVGRLADGGTVPGSQHPYGDSLLTWLAPTEEVTTNRRGQADNFRRELKDINSGMSRTEVARRMLARGLANGGTVGKERVRVDGAGVFDVTGGNRAVRVARNREEARAHQLEVLNAQQRIRDLKRDLAERARTKKGKKTKRPALTGLDRKIARTELAQARADLGKARNQTEAKRQAIAEARERIEKRRLEAEQTLLDKVKTIKEQLTGAAGVFTTGTTSATRLLKNLQTDAQTGTQWGALLQRLQGAKLDKGLLEQFQANGPSRQALALGQSILKSGNIAQLNAAQTQINRQASATADYAAGKTKSAVVDPRTGALVNIENFNTTPDMSINEVAERLWFQSKVRT